MPAPVNEKLELAHQFVLHTNRNVFLTGKAGTGKTTFLHAIKNLSAKRLAVVAPTGVAAINAGGVTIHSLFQLPFGPLIPGAVQREARRFSREKINLLRTLDLLVIDEISMVRADVLDGIDEVLRRYRSRSEPFGGVQLLMIGDMQQLPPVIKDDEWHYLSSYYDTGYFFGSRALRQTAYVMIELSHIYRQSDEQFISLLNSIREKTVTRAQLDELNQRHVPNFLPADRDGYITLTTHNSSAQQINSQKLAELKPRTHRFTASVEGEFPSHAYPTEADLDLKVGAQVMFIKNDISGQRLYYNGKIGIVTDIDGDLITVTSDAEEIPVEKTIWENIRYVLDDNTKEIKGEIIGTFTQVPLKLAWAITIHKSQGLTFERAIIDASAAFAHGQVYVALSRCKSLGGLVLRTPIPSHSIKTEQTLEDFHEQVQLQTPTEQHLHDAKRANQEMLLHELFSFERATSLLYRCRRVVNEHSGSLPDELPAQIAQLTETLRDKARTPGDRFAQQLPAYFAQEALPEANEPLQERVRKAGTYFQTLLNTDLLPVLRSAPTDTDNKQVREALFEAMDELEKELFSKLRSFESVLTGFDALRYLQARNRAELDFKPARRQIDVAEKADAAGRGLYGALVKWRDDVAGEHDTSGFLVLPHKTIAELVRVRPTTIDELLTIKGFGKTKVKQIGNEVLAVIREFVNRPKDKKNSQPKEPKVASATTSLLLFRAGKSVADVAKERGLALTTIQAHLADCISAGDLDVTALLPADRIDVIRTYLEANPSGGFSEAVQVIGNGVTYADIRYVRNAMLRE